MICDHSNMNTHYYVTMDIPYYIITYCDVINGSWNKNVVSYVIPTKSSAQNGIFTTRDLGMEIQNRP